MNLSFDQAAELLDEIAESFPPALFDGLLGRYINLYFGSFAVLAEQENWSPRIWARELRQTLSHELTHHMEARAGLHALDDKDAAEMDAWREELGDED